MKLVRIDNRYEVESPMFHGSITLDAAKQMAARLTELVTTASECGNCGGRLYDADTKLVCRDCLTIWTVEESGSRTPDLLARDHWEPPRGYDHWRHGGWYVTGVRWPNGGSGCVSRQMLNPATGKPDRKWRIVCDRREEDHTYASRDEAARAERRLVMTYDS